MDPKNRPPKASSSSRFRWESLEVFSSSPIILKHAYFSLLASFFLPGLGSILDKKTRKGLFLLVPYLIVLVLFLATVREFIGFIFLPFLLYLWILGMWDATAFIRQSWRSRFSAQKLPSELSD